MITFHHDIDSMRRDPAHPDVSTVHRTLEAMYERGPGFEERWALSSEPDAPCGLAERKGPDGSVLARIAHVGDVALAAWGGPEPGGARYVERDGWLPEPGRVPVDDALGVNEAVSALALGSSLPEGWARNTVETT
jgi:hypothetical protein